MIGVSFRPSYRSVELEPVNSSGSADLNPSAGASSSCASSSLKSVDTVPTQTLALNMLPRPLGVLDTNTDKEISKEELSAGFLLIGQKPLDAQLDRLYQQLVDAGSNLAPVWEATTFGPSNQTQNTSEPTATTQPNTTPKPLPWTLAPPSKSTPNVDTLTTTQGPMATNGGSTSCGAFPARFIGDGWCDAHDPYNTAACAYDGGDCCKPTGSHISNGNGLATGFMDCKDPSSPFYGNVSKKGVIPAPRNPRYSVPESERPQTTRAVATTFNNFYEIAYHKHLEFQAAAVDYFFMDQKWEIQVAGMVDAPQTLRVGDLVASMHLEERYYRHRCVEAWGIAVPWLGFPLAKLLDIVGVQQGAQYVKFISYKDEQVTPNQASRGYTWPYVEAVTIEEARNELAFLTVGLYQKPITASNGAPIRLTLPWKYGFKSIKSIRRIEFLARRPKTFWGMC